MITTGRKAKSAQQKARANFQYETRKKRRPRTICSTCWPDDCACAPKPLTADDFYALYPHLVRPS